MATHIDACFACRFRLPIALGDSVGTRSPVSIYERLRALRFRNALPVAAVVEANTVSVENISVVDLIGVDTRSGNVVLTISDHLEWDDGEHVLLLQHKLNTYLGFIESGELLDRYPNAKGRTAQIAVVFKHAPDALAEKFLSRASALTSDAASSSLMRSSPTPAFTCTSTFDFAFDL